jgi:uncharacterized protein (DUF488 family)
MMSIGHGLLRIEAFLALLDRNEVDVLVDVRSAAYSRRAPDYAKLPLARSIVRSARVYEHLAALGGRPQPGPWYRDGSLDYAELARAPFFTHALDRLLDIGGRTRACILCSEEDPARCHRTLLVGRVLAARGVLLEHIRHDGRVESQGEVEARVLRRAPRQLKLL